MATGNQQLIEWRELGDQIISNNEYFSIRIKPEGAALTYYDPTVSLNHSRTKGFESVESAKSFAQEIWTKYVDNK